MIENLDFGYINVRGNFIEFLENLTFVFSSVLCICCWVAF